MQVSNLHLVTPAHNRCSAVPNVSATFEDFPRLEIHKRAAPVKDMVTVFLTSELEDRRERSLADATFLHSSRRCGFTSISI